ncbi:hypothetical protein QBC39DRAFT_331405 [Podospora conica]|nr:hypothetical protein QBC39DRAFT_331405 [Schizothecium conicum]
MLLFVWQLEREDGMNECGEEIDSLGEVLGTSARVNRLRQLAIRERVSGSWASSSSLMGSGPVDGPGVPQRLFLAVPGVLVAIAVPAGVFESSRRSGRRRKEGAEVEDAGDAGGKSSG